MTLILGAHISIGHGFLAAAHEAVDVLHANAVQFFVRNPRGSKGALLTEQHAEEFREYIKAHKMTVVVHAPYVLNFSRSYQETPWAVKTLADDLIRCDRLGGIGVVLHMGKALGGTAERALTVMAGNIKRALAATKKCKAKIIIENTAGQGSEIGYRFEAAADVMRCVGRTSRLAFCFDTQHAFAAGYDVASAAGWKKTESAIERTIEWKRVACIHLNDSKKPLGSRVDRHENIGKGVIGTPGIMRVVQFARRRSIPLILETPLGEDYKWHLKDLKTIRSRV
jgi:deoxyribonuclease-4